MDLSSLIVNLITMASIAAANETTTTQADSRGFGSEQEAPVSNFVPAQGYFYPGIPTPPKSQEMAVTSSDFEQDVSYMTAVVPAAKTALQVVLKLFAQVGFYIVGGAALLAVGGIFTTLLCNFTPICTISFNGYDLKALNKETVRSLMTPDRIASAAAMVQDAIAKYQRLQRAVDSRPFKL